MNLNNLFDSMTLPQPMNEGRVKELEMDIVDPLMSDSEFETKYEDSRENMARELGMTQDRKTGRFYDPDEEFDRLRNSPEFGAQMRRMAQQEGVAEMFADQGSGSTRLSSRGEKKISNIVRKALAKNSETPDQIAARKDFQAQTDARMRQKKKEQGVAEGLNDTQKKIEDTINKLEDRLKHAKSDEQWDRISARIERLQAGLKRSKQGVAEGSLQDRLKKYVRPVVKTTPKIERTTNPAGRTTDHVEWKVTGPTGDVNRFSSKKAAQAHYDSFGQPDVANESNEKSEPWVDAKLKRRMDYAFGHYSGYKDRPEAFFKWIMNSIDHSEQNDQQHDERFNRVEREIERLQSRLQTVNEQHGSAVANRFSQRLAEHFESDRPQQDHTQQYFAESRTAKRAVIKEILSQTA